jgi:hypothetical protein
MGRFARAVAGLVAVLLALAGCAALADLAVLQSDLDAAGYQASNVNHTTMNGYSTLSIVATMPDQTPTEANGDEVSELVWTTYSGEFDRLQVVLNGQLMVDKDVDELRSQFGDRPEGMPSGGTDRGTNVVMIVVVVVIALVFTGLMVLLWRRGRRRAVPAAPRPPVYPFQPPPS